MAVDWIHLTDELRDGHFVGLTDLKSMAVILIKKSGELDQLRKMREFSENGFFLEKTKKKRAVILEPSGPDLCLDSFDCNVVTRHPELREAQDF